MKPNFFFRVCLGFVLLLLLAACKQQPVPISNPPAIETSLASTARALAKQTETANPFTATPSPTRTETLTPTPRISLNGTSLVVADDQSILFTDHKLGYQMTVPAGWLAVRLNEDEYYKAFNLEAVAQSPAILDLLSRIQTLDGNHVRLVAVDLQGVSDKDLLSGFTVILQHEKLKTIDDWVIAHQNSSKKVDGYQFLTSKSQETALGTKIVVREEKFRTATGKTKFSRKIILTLSSGILVIDFETDLDTKDTNLPGFEQVVDSITLIDP
jgi:hypothetical protein